MTDLPRRPKSELPLVQLLPNLITVSAVCAGLSAIRMAIAGRFPEAVGLILLAAVLDGLDGRVARLLKSESAIGAEIDSLGDFVNFGVAPALTLYLWGLDGQMPHSGWIAAQIYIICCLLRLARFNIGNRAPETPDHFTGVPSPAGALLALLPVFLAQMTEALPPMPAPLVAVWMIFVGALMIGRFPTPSFKKATIYAENVRLAVVGFAALVAALALYPWTTLVVLDLSYAAMLVWTWVRRRRTSTEESD